MHDCNELRYKSYFCLYKVNTRIVDNKDNIDDMIQAGVNKAKEVGILEKDDRIAIAGGASILDGQNSEMNKTIGGILKVE